jgi:ATP-dependent phosphofructokinase / diphosphate-dependent phosphofructokinase
MRWSSTKASRGRWCHCSGTYTSVPIETIGQGLKRVDVDELYDPKAYRPLVRQIDGMPMFLY